MISTLSTICGLVICMLIFYFNRYSKNNSIQFKLYKLGHISITINLLISIFRIMTNNFYNDNYLLIYFLNILFHISNTFCLCIFSNYCIALAPQDEKIQTKYLNITNIPYLIISLIIITTPISNLVYYIEDSKIKNGPLFIISFFTAILSFFVIIVNTYIINRKKMPISQKYNIALIIFIPTILLALEFFNPELILSGFSYACNLLIIYNSFHIDEKDEFSGFASKAIYNKLVKKSFDKNKQFSVFFIKIDNLEFLKAIFLPKYSKIFFAKIIEKLAISKYSSEPFYLGNNIYALISNVYKDEDIEDIIKDIKLVLSTPINVSSINNVNIKYRGCVAKCLNVFNNYEDILFLEKNLNDYIIDSEITTLNENTINDIETKKIIINNIIQVVNDFDKCNDLNNIDKINTSSVLVYYQPIKDNKTNTFLSAEALIRLKIDDIESIIYPDKFISYLENKNFIHRYSCIVLSKVCEFLKECEEKNIEIEGISINFSSIELMDNNFEKDIEKIVNKYNISPQKIHIEITETMQINDLDTIRNKMIYLKEKGFKFYLDDFGTGYSNLSKLVDLPFDVVKFDKSLIDKSLYDEKTKELVNLLSIFMKQQKFKILFEGIEDIDGEILMKTFGVNYAQGYKYSRPISQKDTISFFLENQKEKGFA